VRDLILSERVGSVAVVTLNRPERHNSLVPALLTALLAALTAIHADASVRAVLLRANGRSFSTGGDAQGFVDHAEDIAAYSREIVGLLNQVILALIDLPMPVIAAVHGIVTGGSMGLILGADIVLVAPAASFTPYYSVVGPSPDGGWTALLPELIGRRRAAAVLFGNETITAETAVAWGLANRLIPAADLQAEALRAAQDIAAKQPGSIRRTRRLLYGDREAIAARLAAELDHFTAEMASGAGLTGFQSFLAQLKTEKTA
jgi:2-(1,2-epoxy-1,2-dihydrophenyl)acetyl-CoA isomerase